MVTKEELNDYLVKLESDIFMDGSFYYNDEQWELFAKMWLKAIKEKFKIKIEYDEDWYENMWEEIEENDIDSDKNIDLGLEILAKWINENDIEYDLDLGY
jgi:hypothetical protein